MSTVIQKDTKLSEESSSDNPAPKMIPKNTKETILAALDNNKRLILLTCASKKGKTTLIHILSKDIASRYRIVAISGEYLPNLKASNDNSSNSELNVIKDFILQSADLDDKLVVILDDAHCIPVSFLSELIKQAKRPTFNTHSLQLILSGPANFKDQLLCIDHVKDEDLIHCSIDSLSNQEILTYAKNKTYKISSNITRLEFKPESLRILANFIQTDQNILDVILEWCAAIAKKDQLTSITHLTVKRAIEFAKQFSKDKNLRLVNSYPPSHEVYKYINDLQSDKNSIAEATEILSTKITEKSIEKKNKPFIKINNNADTQETKIPTITAKLPPTKARVQNVQSDKNSIAEATEILSTKITEKSIKKKNKPFIKINNNADTQETKIPTITAKLPPTKARVHKNNNYIGQLDNQLLQSLHDIENEIMPTQWTPSSKRETVNNKSFPAMAILLSLLVISFITFIAFRIGSDPKIEGSPKDQVALNEPEVTLPEAPIHEEEMIENHLAPEVIVPRTSSKNMSDDNALNLKAEKHKELKTVIKEHVGIVASDTKNPVDVGVQTQKPILITKKNIVASEIKKEKINRSPTNKKPEKNNDRVDKDQDIKDQPVAQKSDGAKEISSASVEINNLLVLAANQFKNKHLSTPKGDNALETYQQILVKDPNNKNAENGINEIREKYINWANYYLLNNEIKRAKHFFNRALIINPNDTVVIANLQKIAKQETAKNAKAGSTTSPVISQNTLPSKGNEKLLIFAAQNMRQIENDINSNQRNYKLYRETQVAYQKVLHSQPGNQEAIRGLSLLKNYYTGWAELQFESHNYNIALFLYDQALAIEPGNSEISQRIEEIRQLKSAL